MDDLCEIIASIIQEKEEAKRFPVHAMFNEIAVRYKSEDLLNELEALEVLGMLKSGNTINSTYYLLID